MNVYVYLVYENYRRYRDYNKFQEIGITANQVKIKEKYKLEFFSVPAEYVERVYRYIQEKFVKFPFPISVRSGELQCSCSDFITKCNNLQQEKALTLTTNTTPLLLTLPPPPPALLLIDAGTPHAPSTKVIVLVKNKENEDVTVISSDPSTFLMAFSPGCPTAHPPGAAIDLHGCQGGGRDHQGVPCPLWAPQEQQPAPQPPMVQGEPGKSAFVAAEQEIQHPSSGH
jgi:hypothetical protein